MDYTNDSDISEDTKDLVSQGLASVRCKRVTTSPQIGRLRERVTVPNMDTSSVRHPLWREAAIGDTSIHGLVSLDREIIIGQNHNNVMHG